MNLPSDALLAPAQRDRMMKTIAAQLLEEQKRIDRNSATAAPSSTESLIKGGRE